MTYWVPEASGKLIKANHLQRANVGTSTTSPMNKHKWEFAPRFRRDIFGWKSDLPIKRIKEALTEIRKIARKEPALAAEGAVLLLEKLSPALMHVDSSSGALGSAVNKAIEVLVPIIATGTEDAVIKEKWLDRLWQAIEDDQMPYIEHLKTFWGELCATRELASHWADTFLPTTRYVMLEEKAFAIYNGQEACLSALYFSGRYDEIKELVTHAQHKYWHDQRWLIKALFAQGKKTEAIQYAHANRGPYVSEYEIAEICEDILLSSGMHEEAYQRYGLIANQATTNLATFRAITKKYPHKDQAEVLNDLVDRDPLDKGKWFAAAKDAGLYDRAIALIQDSPTDPRTLFRACRDYAEKRPGFALASGLAAFKWIGLGYGYEIDQYEVRELYQALVVAATHASLTPEQLAEHLQALIAITPQANQVFLMGAMR
jgi:hypothetical protein